MLRLTWRGEELALLPQRALAWRRTLVIADPHFGKAAALRARGIPVPEGGTATDLARLDDALAASGAERLVILGDCLHARSGRAPEVLDAVAAWRTRHRTLAVVLVRGNHDAHAGDPPDAWAFDAVDDPCCEGPFAFRHHPEALPRAYVLAGHLHPGVTLSGGGDALRAPCFWFGAEVGVLPAFGGFTGAMGIAPVAGDRVFAVGPDAVVEVALARRAGG